ncbi:MAG: hypothetical protein JJU10_03590 [Idiomarina sp.]|nr:hypothetical protein [Idiomarina sp.]
MKPLKKYTEWYHRSRQRLFWGVFYQGSVLTAALVSGVSSQRSNQVSIRKSRLANRQDTLRLRCLCQCPIHTHSTESLCDFISSTAFQKNSQIRYEPIITHLPSNDATEITLPLPPAMPPRQQWERAWLVEQGYTPADWYWDSTQDSERVEMLLARKTVVDTFMAPIRQRGIHLHALVAKPALHPQAELLWHASPAHHVLQSPHDALYAISLALQPFATSC